MDMKRKSTSSDIITRAYIDSLLLEMRHLDAVTPTTEFELYGRTFRTPVMTAALSHLHNTCEDGMIKMAQGAAEAGAVTWAGMGSEEEMERMCATGAAVIKVIKPYADRQMIRNKIRHAESCGAMAVGIDIDHAFGRKGYDEIEGKQMRPMTTAEIADLAAFTKLPFVIKGVLSRQDARKCCDAGVRGMVVSHHNGRMDTCVPPLMILPEILEETGGSVPLFVDCSLRTGQDVFKALALGATACSIGRPLMPRLQQEGAEGCRKALEEITAELRYVMSLTGTPDIKHVDRSVIRPATFGWN